MDIKHEYVELAALYDIFMEEVDYEGWAEKLLNLASIEKGHGKILEIGCGTGNLTAEFLKKGFEVVALDISSEMLTEAEDKLKKHRNRLKLVQQDMRTMDVGKGFHGVFCGCDGFNYILDEKELLSVFKKCYNALTPGGSFVFDISSDWKIVNVLGNNSFREERENCEIFWTNSYDTETEEVEMDITFFVPEKTGKEGDVLYRKFEEYHIQRAYKMESIIKMLSYEGFEGIKAFGGDGCSAPREKDERLFFTCRAGTRINSVKEED